MEACYDRAFWKRGTPRFPFAEGSRASAAILMAAQRSALSARDEELAGKMNAKTLACWFSTPREEQTRAPPADASQTKRQTSHPIPAHIAQLMHSARTHERGEEYRSAGQ